MLRSRHVQTTLTYYALTIFLTIKYRLEDHERKIYLTKCTNKVSLEDQRHLRLRQL